MPKGTRWDPITQRFMINGGQGGNSGYNSDGNHRAFGDRDIHHSMAGA